MTALLPLHDAVHKSDRNAEPTRKLTQRQACFAKSNYCQDVAVAELGQGMRFAFGGAATICVLPSAIFAPRDPLQIVRTIIETVAVKMINSRPLKAGPVKSLRYQSMGKVGDTLAIPLNPHRSIPVIRYLSGEQKACARLGALPRFAAYGNMRESADSTFIRSLRNSHKRGDRFPNLIHRQRSTGTQRVGQAAEARMYMGLPS